MVAKCATCGAMPDLSRAKEAMRRMVDGEGGTAAAEVAEQVIMDASPLVRAGLLGGWTYRHIEVNPTHKVVFYDQEKGGI